MKKSPLPSLLSLLLLMIVVTLRSSAAPAAPLRTLYSGHHFLPPYANPRDRFGFDSDRYAPLTNYDVAQLNAGWYSDWGADLDPAHPDRLTYVQLIRFTAGADPHDPAQVRVSPSRAVIAQIAAAHPGALWFMSNEPDSIHQGNPIYPEVYAHVYHEFYTYIKGLDPTALIANGGIVQPTPCRLEYLDIIRDTYQQAYGEPMPVDVWNIHAFILREVYNEWGGATPPGVDPSCGIPYPLRDADNIDILREHLIGMRQWMKERGEQHKPLIISEYGVLWPEWLRDEDGHGFPPDRVNDFMVQTFDLFLNESYPDVGYPEDGYRLVQAWAWYSLSDDYHYNGYLFHRASKQLSPMGQAYVDYTAALPDTPHTDLAVQLWVDLEPLAHIPPTASYDALTVTLPVTGTVTNLGKLPAIGVTVASPVLGFQDTRQVFGRYDGDVPPLPLPALVITRPAVYEPALIADPTQEIADPRRWNNVVTVTVDARPDLLIPMTGGVQLSETLSDMLSVTVTVGNKGTWPSPPVSGTLTLSSAQGSLLLSERFPIAAIAPGAQATVVRELAPPAPNGGLYRLALEVDGDRWLDEQDEGNNQFEMEVDSRPDLLLSTPEWRVQSHGTMSDTLSVTLTVVNEGSWHSLPVSGTLTLSNVGGSLLLPGRRFPIPSLRPGAQAQVVEELTLPPLSDDFSRLTLEVDSDGVLDEQDEDNNRAEIMIPVIVTTTLQHGEASVLTSNSGHLEFRFPAGTVETATEIRFTPRLPPEPPPGPLRGVTAFTLAAYRDGQPTPLTPTLPITVTWQYTETDVAGLDEDSLGLYHLTEDGRWQRVCWSAEQRQPEANRLTARIQALGEYLFGQRYDIYLPLCLGGSGGSGSQAQSQPQLSAPEALPDAPSRLPPWATPPVPH